MSQPTACGSPTLEDRKGSGKHRVVKGEDGHSGGQSHSHVTSGKNGSLSQLSIAKTQATSLCAETLEPSGAQILQAFW